MGNNRGFTLVEAIVVTAIFVVVLMVTTNAFQSIISRAGGHAKTAQSNIEGIVGLEVLRADLAAAGFGLPWSFSGTIPSGNYRECSVGADNLVVGINPTADFNDAVGTAPRAILHKTPNPITVDFADYLVIKSTNVGIAPAAKKWSYVTYSSTSVGKVTSWASTADQLQQYDRVITINTTFTNTGLPNRQLIVSSGEFAYTYNGSTPNTNYIPVDPSQTFIIYGVSSENIKMPFNRADYFVYRYGASTPPVGKPERCAPGTGVLTKAPIKQSDGSYEKLYSLLDCVLDMKVSYIVDPNNDGNTGITKVIPGDAEAIRTQVKSVRVYILAQEGAKDPNFTYPQDNIFVGPYDPVSGIQLLSQGKKWSSAELQSVVGSDWMKYRWKVYEITSKLRNLSN